MYSAVKYHPYHLVTISPWPLLISVAAYITALGGVMYMHAYKFGLFTLIYGIINVIVIMGLWWRDVIREATFEGMHTTRVQKGLRIGFVLFIVSEVMFFFGFFWAFFHSSLTPAIELGCTWPPEGIVPFDPLSTPLVNTLILLLSGATITYTHHALVTGNVLKTFIGFIETLIYAIAFTSLQCEEYIHAPFSISDGIYGSVFYLITGLHGFHVIIGTLFISVCFLRFLKGHFSREHHLGFEFAAWYWHFVDVVWLFVYIMIYWWGGYETGFEMLEDEHENLPFHTIKE
jgi:heme/copper-type cytochrome/quinol oxidase subunit 3